jgi:hypothetical protein
MRALKNQLKALLRLVFELAQRLGVDILPRHFYSQIPDISELRRELYWRAPSSMYGIAGSALPDQIAFIDECCPIELCSELSSKHIHQTAIRENGEDGGYGTIEAEFLYCFIRTRKPQKIIQVGCGVSTSVILRAAHDAQFSPEIICIEPYPTPFLEKAASQGRLKLERQQAQRVELSRLTDLDHGDLLFVDSTHTVKAGSEVNRIILEVLPRLRPGVWAHFHDIYFPFDYGRDLLGGGLFFGAESTLLQAFLVHNARFSIRGSLSMMHYGAPDRLKQLFVNYEPQGNDQGLKGSGGKHFPSAIYLLAT